MTTPLDATRGIVRPPVREIIDGLGAKLRTLPFLFAVLAALFGTFLVFSQPPGQGLDEAQHFYHVWSMAHGTFIAPIHSGAAGGYIPHCVVDYIGRFATEASQRGPFSVGNYWASPVHCSSRTAFTDVGTTASYGPISYLPSIITVGILDRLGTPLPLIFFAGRWASLAVFIFMYYWAIRITPIGKQVLFVLGLLPTTLLLASSYSADPMTIALAMLGVALILRCLLNPDADLRTVVVLFIVLLCLGLTKPNLFVFAPLMFLVPAPAMDPLRQLQLWRTAAVVVILASAGLWYLAVRHVVGVPVPLLGLNAHTQTQFIVHHPIGYLGVLARTFFEGTGQGRWIPGFFFSIGFDRPYVADNLFAPIGIVIVGTVTLWYAFQQQIGKKREVGRGELLVAGLPIALMAIGIIVIETSLFVYGTPVGLPYTLAQGRYFIPLSALPLVSIGLLREPRRRARTLRWIVLGTLIMLIWLVLKVFVHDFSL